MTIDTDDVETGILRSRLPLNLDPLTVNTVSEFCGTERESIFFLLQKNDSKLARLFLLYVYSPLGIHVYNNVDSVVKWEWLTTLPSFTSFIRPRLLTRRPGE